jgi:hypothetical protein
MFSVLGMNISILESSQSLETFVLSSGVRGLLQKINSELGGRHLQLSNMDDTNISYITSEKFMVCAPQLAN